MDKNSFAQDFDKMDFPEIRTEFRSKLRSMEDLLK